MPTETRSYTAPRADEVPPPTRPTPDPAVQKAGFGLMWALLLGVPVVVVVLAVGLFFVLRGF